MEDNVTDNKTETLQKFDELDQSLQANADKYDNKFREIEQKIDPPKPVITTSKVNMENIREQKYFSADSSDGQYNCMNVISLPYNQSNPKSIHFNDVLKLCFNTRGTLFPIADKKSRSVYNKVDIWGPLFVCPLCCPLCFFRCCFHCVVPLCVYIVFRCLFH